MKTIVISLITLITLFSFPFHSYGQSVIDGYVLNSDGKPVDAFVTASKKGSNSIFAYADTDSKGFYKLIVNELVDSVSLTVSGLAIDKQNRLVKNITQHLDFRSSDRTREIREVVVKLKRVEERGDTIDYNVAAFEKQDDRVIADVIKRMPGMEVKDNGQITYNGKAISNFYIEERDMLQGRYGIAVNNVNSSDVLKVQVLENHQPTKMLQGKVMSDNVAVNLKLKNSAKGTVAINTMLGLGGQVDNSVGDYALLSGEVVGMFFNKNRQHMTVYKGNNTGDDVARDLTEHYRSTDGVYAFCPMNIVMPTSAGLDQKRYFDNSSHIVTANHLESLGYGKELKCNVDYHHDDVVRSGSSMSDIFYEDSTRIVTEETLSGETTTNNLKAGVQYDVNTAMSSLKNATSVEVGWNSDDCEGILTSNVQSLGSRLQQHFSRPTMTVSNNFNTLVPVGDGLFGVVVSAGFAQRNNTLSVNNGGQEYVQDLNSCTIQGRAMTSYSREFGKVTGEYFLNVGTCMRNISTDLEGFSYGDCSTKNDLRYNIHNVMVGQMYNYKAGRFYFEVKAPLQLLCYQLTDKVEDNNNVFCRFVVSPSGCIKYVNFNWDANVNVSYDKDIDNAGNIYSGYVMNNYRSFQRSLVETLSTTQHVKVGAGVSYRNALTELFWNIGANYSLVNQNQIYGYDYEGVTSIVKIMNKQTELHSFTVGTNLSKGFEFMQSKVSVFANLGLSDREHLIGGKLYTYDNTSYSFGGTFGLSPLPWIGLVYSSGFGINTCVIRDTESSHSILNHSQRVGMTFYPVNRLSVTVSADETYNNLTDENRTIWMGDVKVKYKIKKVEMEMQINNIFNQKNYTRVTYSGTDIYRSTCQLRPFNVLATVRLKLL